MVTGDVDLLLPPGDRVLDVGSAAGSTALDLARKGHRVSAVEIDPALVEEFRARPGSGRVDLRLADAGHLPFPDGVFGCVLLIEVLEHVVDADRVVREVGRVLRPGAVAVFAVPTGYTERVYGRLHPRYVEQSTHRHVFSRDEVEAILRRSGLVVERVHSANLVPAISWLLHSLLRSDADHTGRVLEHRWVDGILRLGVGAVTRTPGLRRLWQVLDRRVGKSWYFYGVKAHGFKAHGVKI